MLRIIRELKPFTLLITIIIALLLIQASAELSLPDYMSDIVNIGIQQNGIENTVPMAIKEKDMENIKIFLKEEERELVNNSYKLIDRKILNRQEYDIYINKYPILYREDLYILETDSRDHIERMNTFFAKAIAIVSEMEKKLPHGKDPHQIIRDMPMEKVDELKQEIDKQLNVLPENIINQSAINYIKVKYEEIGIDIKKTQSNYIFYIGGIMILISLIGMLASITVGFLSARISAGVGRNLRDKVFKRVIGFSSKEFNWFSTASLITRSTNDIQQIQMFTGMMLRMVFYAPILGIGGIIRALKTNTSMAWIVAVGVMSILTLVIFLFTVVMKRFKKLQELVDNLNRVMRESLSGMLIVRAFNTQEYEENKFDNANKDLTSTNLFVSRVMNLMMPTMILIMNGITLLVIWVGAKEIDNAAIQVGDMMAFMQYTMQIIMSFLMISMISIILPRASVSIDRIAEVLNTDTIINDPTHPKEMNKDMEGLLEFKNVSFRYSGAGEYVLKDISFTARPRETTAFIGSTGSGKSTLINLIPRFYDVSEGEILLDGIDIRDIKLSDLREKIGYVPQKGILFTGTIESNIRYGKNINASDEDIKNAIRIAQAEEFISEREGGILSEISQGGTNVSGGQRQRLSIARALAKKPEIFIFDDSFSALDFKTDAALRKAMNEDIRDRTVLIVAQRISSIMQAEKIIVLDEGEIVGMGTHKELLKNCEVYRQIALSQLSEEELII